MNLVHQINAFQMDTKDLTEILTDFKNEYDWTLTYKLTTK